MRNGCIRKVISDYFFLCFFAPSFSLSPADRCYRIYGGEVKIVHKPECVMYRLRERLSRQDSASYPTLANNSPEAIENGEVLGDLLLCLCRQGATQPHRKFLPADSTFRSRTREKAIVSTESTVPAQKFTTAIADAESSRGTTRTRARGFVPSFETSWIMI